MAKKMPLIATPVPHFFENHEHAIEIIAASDCLEVRERSWDSVWPNQLLFHIDKDLTLKWYDDTRAYLEKIINQKPDLELVTFQATRCCEGERIIDGQYQASGKIYSRQQLLDNAGENLQWLRGFLDKGIKIGLENNNYLPTPAYDIVTDSDFISEVVNELGIHLLLDIAHAMVTCHNQGLRYNDYVNSLPLARLIQLHICRPEVPSTGIARDSHEAPDHLMMREVVALVKKYPQIRYLTIEYYKDKDRLVQSLRELQKTLGESI